MIYEPNSKIHQNRINLEQPSHLLSIYRQFPSQAMNIIRQYNYQMKLTLYLLLIFCLQSTLTLRILKGKELPQDYAIGKLMQVNEIGKQRLFFRTIDNIMGIIDSKTGVLLRIYELDNDQKIIDVMGGHYLVIAKGKEINLFFPKDQAYIKLQYSDFLEKQKFSKVLAFRRFFRFDYVLTDEFLLKAINPNGQELPFQAEKSEQFQIIATRKDNSETFMDLVFLLDRNPENAAVALAFIKGNEKTSKICLKKMFINKAKISEVCMDADPKEKVLDIVEVGSTIMVTYETYSVVADHQLRIKHEIRKRQTVFFDQGELKLVQNPNSGKNLASADNGVILFYNFGNPKAANNMQPFQKYMLLRKEDKIVVNIEKEPTDVPSNVWAFTPIPRPELNNNSLKEYLLIVAFENGKIMAYKINQQQKNSKKLWNFTTKAASVAPKGQQKEAEEVDLQTEEKMIQQNEKADQPASEKEDQPDLGESNSPSHP